MRVTCLIPAWNEASRIAGVLACVVGHPLIDQVVVVDDGSTDGTGAIAAAAGAELCIQTPNAGKSAAMARGLAAAQGDLVLMLDADLIGLTADAVTALLTPVLSGRADVTISLRANAPAVWRAIGLDFISGERVMPRSMLTPHVQRIAGLPRFGLEVFINAQWLQGRCRLAVVPLAGVSSPAKATKRGVLRGIWSDVAMMANILATVGPGQVITQILRLRGLRVAVTELSCIVRTGVMRLR
ncbi:MAG: glycosyl transferase [Rhodobacteraceae bacterium PARR1]|nr:MAG: glycosyl transferase [Rhodobacteraceae bacterium PARR1]